MKLTYNRQNAKEKWTIMMYMNDFGLMVAYAYVLKHANSLDPASIEAIIHQMMKDGTYNPRNGGSSFTVTFKIIQIAWYMFGYYDNTHSAKGTKKFVFSPLGNLLLDHIKNQTEKEKIFFTMMVGEAFRQPFSQMSPEFNIYPFRLLFQLLLDERLKGKLYADEGFYLLMFLKTIEMEDYEKLVSDILELRSIPSEDKYKEFSKNQRTLGLACHEWRYLSKLFESAGLISNHNDYGDRVVGTLEYGSLKNGRHTAVRSYREDYMVLNPELKNYAKILLGAYPFYDKPVTEGPDDEPVPPMQRIVDMYSFYPEELLKELGIQSVDPAISAMLDVVNEISAYDHMANPGDDKRFELALTDSFNLFSDVVAVHRGEPGQTDVECCYENNDIKFKFDIDAKSTSNKLMSIQISRIQLHATRVNSRYSLIVTPKYSYGCLVDIKNQKMVLVKSSSLKNYLYQFISKVGRDMSFKDFDDLIEANLGTDISDGINQMVIDNFGLTYSDQTIKVEQHKKQARSL